MEERIKAVEEVVQHLCRDVEDMRNVFKMHIRSHMAEYSPVHVISMRGTTENGISYSWGNYYRAPVTKKKFTQSRVFEFLPNTEITPHEIVELTSIVRIGVSGEKIAEMSPGLQKYFVEVKK